MQLYSKNQIQVSLPLSVKASFPHHLTLKHSVKSNHDCSNSASWPITMKYLTTESHTYLILHLQGDGIITLEKKKE